MKLLLYCTRRPPYLYHKEEYCYDTMNRIDLGYEIENYVDSELKKEYEDNCLNGKIIAECDDYEVEEIYYGEYQDLFWTTSLSYENDILKQSCLKHDELIEYLNPKDSYFGNSGYAIHIKNLKVFDKLKELCDYYTIHNIGGMLLTDKLKRAPQNMQRVSLNEWDYGTYNPKDIAILIPVYSEELYRILNDKQDIIIRKKVLKKIVENE